MRRAARLGAVVAGTGTFLAGAAVARRRIVDDAEAAVFRSANGLPAPAQVPLTVVMQAGSLGAVFAAGALVGRRDHRRGLGVVATGTAVWAGCKVAKNLVGRGRPNAHLDDVVIRGREETGLGYPSGHAAVSFTLAGLLAPSLPPGVRPLLWGVAATVGVARMHVGAHLPLDIVGGAAAGVAVAAAVGLAGDLRSSGRAS